MGRSKVFLIPSPIGDSFGDFSLAGLQIIEAVTHLFAEADDAFIARMRKGDRITAQHEVYFLSGEATADGPFDREACPAKASELVRAGKSFAILASSGLPCFVDPGFDVVNRLLQQHMDEVELVPVGMSSAMDAALSMSGVDIQQFVFLGHVPEYYSIGPEFFAHGFAVVYYVRGPALAALLGEVGKLNLKIDRIMIFKDIRKKSRSRVFLRHDTDLPPGASLESDVDYVVVITQL